MSIPNKFTYSTVVTPDLCGKRPRLTPSAVFLLFQNAACLHAEAIGNGTWMQAERNCYWVATHSRVDFAAEAKLMDAVEVSTWANRSKPNAVRGLRSYDLRRGGELIAEGFTEWVVLNRDGGFLHFSDFGFPEGFEFTDYEACGGKLSRFRGSFSNEDYVYDYIVRTSSIDVGRHMNNVAYVRAFLDCFTADEVAEMPVATMEVRYVTACMEGETLRLCRRRTENGWLLGALRADGKCAAYMSIGL